MKRDRRLADIFDEDDYDDAENARRPRPRPHPRSDSPVSMADLHARLARISPLGLKAGETTVEVRNIDDRPMVPRDDGWLVDRQGNIQNTSMWDKEWVKEFGRRTDIVTQETPEGPFLTLLAGAVNQSTVDLLDAETQRNVQRYEEERRQELVRMRQQLLVSADQQRKNLDQLAEARDAINKQLREATLGINEARYLRDTFGFLYETGVCVSSTQGDQTRMVIASMPLVQLFRVQYRLLGEIHVLNTSERTAHPLLWQHIRQIFIQPANEFLFHEVANHFLSPLDENSHLKVIRQHLHEYLWLRDVLLPGQLVVRASIFTTSGNRIPKGVNPGDIPDLECPNHGLTTREEMKELIAHGVPVSTGEIILATYAKASRLQSAALQQALVLATKLRNKYEVLKETSQSSSSSSSSKWTARALLEWGLNSLLRRKKSASDVAAAKAEAEREERQRDRVQQQTEDLREQFEFIFVDSTAQSLFIPYKAGMLTHFSYAYNYLYKFYTENDNQYRRIMNWQAIYDRIGDHLVQAGLESFKNEDTFLTSIVLHLRKAFFDFLKTKLNDVNLAILYGMVFVPVVSPINVEQEIQINKVDIQKDPANNRVFTIKFKIEGNNRPLYDVISPRDFVLPLNDDISMSITLQNDLDHADAIKILERYVSLFQKESFARHPCEFYSQLDPTWFDEAAKKWPEWYKDTLEKIVTSDTKTKLDPYDPPLSVLTPTNVHIDLTTKVTYYNYAISWLLEGLVNSGRGVLEGILSVPLLWALRINEPHIVQTQNIQIYDRLDRWRTIVALYVMKRDQSQFFKDVVKFIENDLSIPEVDKVVNEQLYNEINDLCAHVQHLDLAYTSYDAHKIWTQLNEETEKNNDVPAIVQAGAACAFRVLRPVAMYAYVGNHTEYVMKRRADERRVMEIDESISTGEQKLHELMRQQTKATTLRELTPSVHVPQRSWQLLPQISGVMQLRPDVVTAMDEALGLVREFILEFKAAELDDFVKAPVDTQLPGAFALLVASLMNQRQLTFPHQYNKDKQYNIDPRLRQRAMTRLRKLAAQHGRLGGQAKRNSRASLVFL